MRNSALKWLINFIIFANDNDAVISIEIWVFCPIAISCLSAYKDFLETD